MRQLGNPLMSSAGLILKFLWDQGVATLPGGTTRGSEVDASSHAWRPGAKMVEGAVCCVVKMLASDTSRFNVRWHGCNQSLIGDHEPLPDNFYTDVHRSCRHFSQLSRTGEEIDSASTIGRARQTCIQTLNPRHCTTA